MMMMMMMMIMIMMMMMNIRPMGSDFSPCGSTDGQT